MSDETEIHECRECGVRQKVDDLEQTDRHAAMMIVLSICTKCSDHPNASTFGAVAKSVGIELESRWQPRVDE